MADYLNYVLSNPDLRENAEALGLTNAEMAQWGQTHYENHGKNEGRQNTPTAITNTEGYTQTLGARHYQGRDPNEVLQASVRSNYRGADVDDYNMWESREGIDPAWNLGQYSSQGWNLAPDNPYKTGILGNTIAVDTGVGQLYDTGDNVFLQDRYEDDSIANDFLPGWVTDGEWTGPAGLGDYWNALSTASRDADGNLRSNIARPTTGWNPLTGMGDGLLNPTVPTFRGPAYQNWTRFMPTDFQLAEGGGRHYQQFVNPYMTGGGGGNFVARPNPIFTTGGGGTGGGTGGGFTGVNTGGNNSGVTTDASGNRWVMTPQGSWVPAGSDYGQGLLGTGRLHPDYNFYDSSGAFVGAEGTSFDATGKEFTAGGVPTGSYITDWSNPIGDFILDKMGAYPAGVQRAIAISESLGGDYGGQDTDADIGDSEVDIAQGVL